MSGRPVRVALFPDSINEVNGVANTCRNWVAYVHRNRFPMLVVSAAAKTEFRQEGTISRLDLQRGPLAFSVEKDLSFDAALVLFRYHKMVAKALREFRPEVVHITGPGDIGMMGAMIAHNLGIPIAASWQTNIHEYAARRADLILPRWLSGNPRATLLQTIERLSFRLAVAYYKAARFHYAPNQELIDKLSAASGRPCSLMERGVDLAMFNPAHRTRGNDGQFVIGYVGRLSTEKKVRSFAGLAKAVQTAGYDHVKFVFVGHGAEETWLSQNIPNVEMTGVLRGDALSRAYANLDLFAFYSETDTFGNVVLEALASGVPAVVTDKGGPKYIVDHERCGYVCPNDLKFNAHVLRLISNRSLHCDMAAAARQRAQRASWDAVFDSVYDAYRRHLPNPEEAASAGRFHGSLDSAAPESLPLQTQELE